jgi:hypothetical protein
MNPAVNIIANRLSLRPPQRTSLEILARICDIISLEKGKLYYAHGDVTMDEIPTPERIERWIRTAIHVQGRPEWIFVKVYTHGVVAHDHEAVLGKWREKLHQTLEEKYNDGKRYRLHYATTREAYNILKAAEAGRSGNPNDYRDFLIPPYANSKILSSVPYDLVSYSPDRIEMLPSFTGKEEVFQFKDGTVEKIQGRIERILIKKTSDEELKVRLRGDGIAWIKLKDNPNPFPADLTLEETVQK